MSDEVDGASGAPRVDGASGAPRVDGASGVAAASPNGRAGEDGGQAGAGPHLLEATSVSIRFGGVQALNDVSLFVDAGEVLGLVGPNGAGKTTMFNCLCGQVRPNKGNIFFDGQRLNGLPVFKRAKLGIGRTFQRLEVFPEMTVREHMLVADRAHRGKGRLWKDLLNLGGPKDDELARVDSVLSLVGLSDVADVPVAALSLGHCRLVELGRALCTEPRLLMADEPSSGLDARETADLADVLRTVQRERDMAVILVEHDLDMVARVVDRAQVVDFGNTIACGTLDEVMRDPAVRRAYLGKTA